MSLGASIIIPFRNSAETIQRTLDSINEQMFDGPAEILLVDDHSTDESVSIALGHRIGKKWAVEEIPNVEGGLANAYNLGAKCSRYDILVFVHSDCYVTNPNALAELVKAFHDPVVVAAQPNIVLPENAWDQMSFWDKVANARYVGKRMSEWCGKFDAIRKKTLLDIGGFDSMTFFSAGEDRDIALRLDAVGRIARVNVDVVHAHVYPKRATLRSLFRKQVQLAQGFGALLRKHRLHILKRPEMRFQVAVHGLKAALLTGLFLPGFHLTCLIALTLLGAFYSLKAFFTPDIRVLAVPFVNIGLFAWFTLWAGAGLVTGKQSFYYK